MAEHPSSPPDQPLSDCGASDAPSSSYAASLVQSAAKSLLIEGNTSMLSDDDSSAVSLPRHEEEEEARLESLKAETLPALPDEQDRKRFIGGLAAVLASSYDYDLIQQEEGASTAAYLEVYVDEDDFDASTNTAYQKSLREIEADERAPLPRNESRDSSFLGDVSEDDEDLLLEDFVTQSPDESQHSRRARSVGEASSTESQNNAVFEGLPPRDPSEPSRSRRGAVERKPSSVSTQSLFQNKRDEKFLRLSTHRHRKRRYQVLSTILLNAAKYLDLEVAHSKAFLPLLAKLLKPLPATSKDSTGSNHPLGLEPDNFVWPFLESMTPGSGIRCLSLLVLQHLLQGEEGYDARVRRAYKKLAVLILAQEFADRDDCHNSFASEWEFASRKFEALEHAIASKILRLSGGGKRKGKDIQKGTREGGMTREQVMRGIKIGSVGLVAGTLFAVTGGLAAPGIAAGVAALAGTSAATAAAVVALTSTAAVTTIFGVGGAGLAAYKMHRRSQGLTEFEFRKESGHENEEEEAAVEAELFTTICLSGWIRDRCDFQRPWGVQPTDPPIKDKLELLERFYTVYKPENIPRCKEILKRWRGEEENLWSIIGEKYGRDPSHLFPIKSGPRDKASLTLDQVELIDQLFIELGYAAPEEKENKKSAFGKMRSGWRNRFSKSKEKEDEGEQESTIPISASDLNVGTSFRELDATSTMESNPAPEERPEEDYKSDDLPAHTKTVWDYQHTYGGELYTVRFESDILIELGDSVEDLAVDAVSNGTQMLLKTTVFATLLTAVAIPTALLKVANMIDGSWTLAIERSDEAGKELARSLLFSQAGRRPVSLVGYSMGARIIYVCLKELARYQEKWEEMRELDAKKAASGEKNKSDRSIVQEFGVENMREPASILEDVILMGMPNHLSLKSWYLARQLVAGRLVNCYSRKDLVLALMFRYKRMTTGWRKVCGTCAIDVPGVENYDVTDLISGHAQYCTEAGTILKRVKHGQPIRGPHNTPPVVAVVGTLKQDESKNPVVA